MTEAVISRLNSIKLRLAAFSPTSARAHLENSLNRKRMLLDNLTLGMEHTVSSLLSQKQARSELLRHKMEALSPLAVLQRGYSMVTDKDGHVIKNVSQVAPGDDISIRVSDGMIIADVQEVHDGR